MTRQSIAGGPALGLALLSLSFGPSVWSACAPRPATFARAPRPVELPVQAPAFEDASIPDLDEEEPVAADEPDTEPPALPAFWAEVYGHTQPFATALQNARDSKRAFQAVALSVMMGSDGGIPCRDAVRACERAARPDEPPFRQRLPRARRGRAGSARGPRRGRAAPLDMVEAARRRGPRTRAGRLSIELVGRPHLRGRRERSGDTMARGGPRAPPPLHRHGASKQHRRARQP